VLEDPQALGQRFRARDAKPGAELAEALWTGALARRGVDSLIVDRRLKRSSLPRATTVSTRSMELIRSWGVEQEIVAGGVEVEWLMWESPTLAQAADGVAIVGGLSSVRRLPVWRTGATTSV
jgi:hypothetical protein